MQYRAALKLNSCPFFGGKKQELRNKSCKICHMILCLSFSCNLIGYFKQALNLIGCFVFSEASSLAGRKMRFKAKNGAIREQIASIRAIQITGSTSDFKMVVIKHLNIQ